MSFAKAQELLRLARMAAARHDGVTLDDICAEFGVAHRTAQRMTHALEESFADVTAEDGEDRRRRWRVGDRVLGRLEERSETTLEALEIALRAAEDEGRRGHARAIEGIRDRLLARLSPGEARRSEADAEAVLLSLGQVARPGPKVALRPEVLDAVIAALRGPFRLRIRYGEAETGERVIEPHGLMQGQRSYLVARQPDRDGRLLNFRMDRILAAEVMEDSFAFAPGFSLDAYAAQAFGVYQNPEQLGEVVWRFAPEAAERAGEFRFHPSQMQEPQPDGSLIVRFSAAGWLEMAWHLYQWGDKVEVLAPEGLRRMVEGHRRGDFDALP